MLEQVAFLPLSHRVIFLAAREGVEKLEISDHSKESAHAGIDFDAKHFRSFLKGVPILAVVLVAVSGRGGCYLLQPGQKSRRGEKKNERQCNWR